MARPPAKPPSPLAEVWEALTTLADRLITMEARLDAQLEARDREHRP